jgi:hypothetical protein
MLKTHSAWERMKLGYVLAAVAAPAIIFYSILWVNAVRIPILDDYDVILHSLNNVHQSHGLLNKVLFIFTTEHNGYKLMFENVIFLGQYVIFGHAYFLPLVLLGNAFALLIFLCVVFMAKMPSDDPLNKWILLVPVAWLVFQLQYASALDFASCSLQQLPVVFFSLLSILLLEKASDWAFCGSCFALSFAIASSPNGFFVGPVGILLLLQQKRSWSRVAVWLTTLSAMLAIYLFRYRPVSIGNGQGGGLSSLKHLNPIYALSFLGSSIARYSAVGPSLLLGIVLCAVFLLAAWRRYFRQNPAVFYSMLFIIVNAVAVSGLRSDQGVEQSLASRYRTYSNLFLAFSYLFLVESILPRIQNTAIRRAILAAALIISVAFGSLSDIAGARFLHSKKELLIRNYRIEWQRQSPAEDDADKDMNPVLRRQIHDGVFRMDLPVFEESVRNGVFQPPQNP